MKALIAVFLVASMFFTGGVKPVTINDMDYKATFIKNAYFAQVANQDGQNFLVIRDMEQLKSYESKIMTELRKDTAIVPKGYWEGIERDVKKVYARYNAKFFKKNNLIIVLVDQGSGSVKYSVSSLGCNDGLLTINIDKISGMVQTMDFASWFLFLEIGKDACNVQNIKINLTAHIR